MPCARVRLVPCMAAVAMAGVVAQARQQDRSSSTLARVWVHCGATALPSGGNTQVRMHKGCFQLAAAAGRSSSRGWGRLQWGCISSSSGAAAPPAAACTNAVHAGMPVCTDGACSGVLCAAVKQPPHCRQPVLLLHLTRCCCGAEPSDWLVRALQGSEGRFMAELAARSGSSQAQKFRAAVPSHRLAASFSASA